MHLVAGSDHVHCPDVLGEPDERAQKKTPISAPPNESQRQICRQPQRKGMLYVAPQDAGFSKSNSLNGSFTPIAQRVFLKFCCQMFLLVADY